MKRLAVIGDIIHVWNTEYKVNEILEDGTLKVGNSFDSVAYVKPEQKYEIVKSIKPLKIGDSVNTKHCGNGIVKGMFGETWVWIEFENGNREVYALTGDKYLRVKAVEQENFKHLNLL